jgi:hypothetical protein
VCVKLGVEETMELKYKHIKESFCDGISTRHKTVIPQYQNLLSHSKDKIEKMIFFFVRYSLTRTQYEYRKNGEIVSEIALFLGPKSATIRFCSSVVMTIPS